MQAHIERLATFAQHGQPKDYAASDMMRADLEALIMQPIAQPEQAPVLYQFQTKDKKWHSFSNEAHYKNTVASGGWPIRALYTSPQVAQPAPVRQPLTIKEIGAIHVACGTPRALHIEFARAIEAKHGIATLKVKP